MRRGKNSNPTTKFFETSNIHILFFYSKINEAVEANSINGGDSGLDEVRDFYEDEGTGECSPERYAEIKQQKGICEQDALAQFIPARNVLALCPIIEEVFRCLDPYSECYSPEKMVRAKEIYFKVFLETLQAQGNSELVLKKCPNIFDNKQNIRYN